MSSGARTVRKLRLHAGSEEAARRTALKVEDALRVASLPDRGGRLLLVRRLSLPLLQPDASPQSVALALQLAIDTARPEWVHGGASEAARARFVWFTDALDAHVHAARAALAHGQLRGWFWALAIPEIRGLTGPTSLIRALALSLAARPEAPAAVPAWLRALGRTKGGEDALRAAVDANVADRLALVLGVSAEGSSARRDGVSDPGGREHPAGRHTPGPASPAAVDPLLDAAGPGRPLEPQPRERPPSSPAVLDPRRAHETMREELQVLPHSGGASAAPARPAASPHSANWAHRAVTAAAASAGSPQGLFGARHTIAGGLLFLLPVFRQLSYPEWIEGHAAWGRHEPLRRAFVRLLTRLAVPLGDPAWSLALVDADPRLPVPLRFIAPAAWRPLWRGTGPPVRGRSGRSGWITDPSGYLLLAAWIGSAPGAVRGPPGGISDARRSPPHRLDLVGRQKRRWSSADRRLEAVADAWLDACRRWLRRRVGIGLSDLVLRPASLSATATHVDATLDLASVDVRIRRAGLDLDPGWVPWLGRVVSYGYERTSRA